MMASSSLCDDSDKAEAPIPPPGGVMETVRKRDQNKGLAALPVCEDSAQDAENAGVRFGGANGVFGQDRRGSETGWD